MSVFFIRVWVDGSDIVSVRTGGTPITATLADSNATYLDAVASGDFVDAGTLRPTLSYENSELKSTLVTLLPSRDVTSLLAQSGYAGQSVYNWSDGNKYQWFGNPWGATSTSRQAVVGVIRDEIVGGPDNGLSIPSAPTSLGAVGGYQQITLQWTLPTTNTDGSPLDDFARFNIYRNTVDDFETAELIASSAGQSYVDAGLGNEEVYYYWVTTVDFTGNESAPSNTATSTTDFISAADMVADIRQEIGAARIDVVSELPLGAGYEAGDFVFLTTDKKLYQFDGTSWGLAVTAVEAVDISGELTTAQIAVNAITADLLAANAVTTTKIQDGAISTPKIVAGAVTAGTIATGAITAVKIATNAVTSDKIIADAITANKIATNAVTTDALAANSVTADQLTANSVTAGAISAGAVSADKIAVSTLAAINANLGDVTAGSINTVSSGIGLQVNVASRPNAVYTFQNSLTTYGIFSSNVAFGGGTMEIQSNGGFTGQFLNSSNSAGAFGPFAAINAQNTGSGGGHGQVGVSLAGGGYAFRSIDGGYYDVSGDGYNPFTGRHDGMIAKNETYELGDIVVDRATVHRALSDSFTELKPSSGPNQRGAVGVVAKVYSEWYIPAAFIDKEATQANQVDHVPTPENPAAAIVTRLDIADYQDDYDLVNINAVGEGAINVCGENGNIARGDLIVTSSTPGKGMRQSDDVVRSYTVARAREDMTFSSADEVKMIACIYLCG